MVPKCLDYKHSERLVVSEDRVDEHDNEKQCQNDWNHRRGMRWLNYMIYFASNQAATNVKKL